MLSEFKHVIPMERLRMSISCVKDCRRKASSKAREAPLILHGGELGGGILMIL